MADDPMSTTQLVIASKEGDNEALGRFVGSDPATRRAVYLRDEIVGSTLTHDDLTALLDVAWGGQGVSATDGAGHLALIPVFTNASIG